MPQSARPAVLIVSALLATLLCGLLGGSVLAADTQVVRWFGAWRADHPDVTSVVVMLTHLGGAPVLLGIALGAALMTAQRSVREAILLAATVLGGRLMVELLKWLADRPRPAFDAHPVSVFSQSFPSGHAANSMVTYLAFALIAAPARWRGRAAVAAILLSLAIGATRPILGVHWPSDVLGGWAFGIGWVLLCLALARRVRPS